MTKITMDQKSDTIISTFKRITGYDENGNVTCSYSPETVSSKNQSADRDSVAYDHYGNKIYTLCERTSHGCTFTPTTQTFYYYQHNASELTDPEKAGLKK